MVQQAERRRQTRAAMLDAARELFERDGYDATSVDAIVARADVAKGTFYQHFDSKIAVVLALARDELAQVAPRVLADLEGGRDPLDLLDAHLREQCGWFERHRALTVPLIEYGMRLAGAPPPRAPGGSSRGMFEAYLTQAQARGAIRPDYPPAELAAVVSGLSTQVVYTWASQPGNHPLWPRMERMYRLFLEGATQPAGRLARSADTPPRTNARPRTEPPRRATRPRPRKRAR
jgi:TetR/AcrR family transcriptional regulator of autoinduction and epiphytic fitness